MIAYRLPLNVWYSIVTKAVTSIKTHHPILIFLFSSLALACLLAPFLAVGAEWVRAEWPQLLDEPIPFGRIFNRAFMLSAIALFFLMRRQIIPAQTIRRILGLRARVASRNFFTGFGLAIGSTVLLLAVMTAADVYTPMLRLSIERSLQRFTAALASGLAIGFLEEFFFRGMLFLGVLQAIVRWKAYLSVNLFYSAIHFVKPGEEYFVERLDLLAGVRHLAQTFTPFLDPLTLLPGIVGLFLIGVVLSYALERTGNLYLSIGLHAGWVASLKSIRIFGDFARKDLGWAFGFTDPKIVSGIATWVGICLVALAIMRLTRPNAWLSNDRTPATGVSAWPRYARQSGDTRQNWDG